MAIAVERESTRKGMFRIATGIVLIVALFVATYVLFFTTPPQIEVLAPPEVQTISQIAEINVSPVTLTNSPEYRVLDEYIPLPALGEYGRNNPFARF